MKSRISRVFGHDTEKVEKILKIYKIYKSNYFNDGLTIKTSRFNHSCKPNAIACSELNGQNQVLAISDINQGKGLHKQAEEYP